MRFLIGILFLLPVLRGGAQVPFITEEDRLMIFSEGRFEKIAPRPPQRIFPMEGRVVYEAHDGDLYVFISEGRKLYRLQEGPVGLVEATRHNLAWLAGDSLKVLAHGMGEVISTQVEAFTVGDSLIVYRTSAELMAHTPAGVLQLRDLADAPPGIFWTQGADRVAFPAEGALQMFPIKGHTIQLADTLAAQVVAGEGIVAWWQPEAGIHAWYNGELIQLSTQRPLAMQAAHGTVAFTLEHGGLKCFYKGELQQVADALPTAFWLKDDLLVYLLDGQLHLFGPHGTMRVEPYVPEWWQVHGEMLVFLTMDRELHKIEEGRKERVSREANVRQPELFGNSILYTSGTGNRVVVWRGKVHIF